MRYESCPKCGSAAVRRRFVLRDSDGLYRGPAGTRVARADAQEFGGAEAGWLRAPAETIVLV